MNKAVFLSLFIAIPALSCPNLSGTYLCEDEDGTYESTITQRIENGVTIYTVSTSDESNEIITDGQPYLIEDSEEGQMYMTSTCEGTAALANRYDGTMLNNGQEIGTMDGDFRITKEGNIIRNRGTVLINYGGQQHVQEVDDTCTEI